MLNSDFIINGGRCRKYEGYTAPNQSKVVTALKLLVLALVVPPFALTMCLVDKLSNRRKKQLKG
jgi:hypothetical protein